MIKEYCKYDNYWISPKSYELRKINFKAVKLIYKNDLLLVW